MTGNDPKISISENLLPKEDMKGEMISPSLFSSYEILRYGNIRYWGRLSFFNSQSFLKDIFDWHGAGIRMGLDEFVWMKVYSPRSDDSGLR